MDAYEKIKELCTQRNIKLSSLAAGIGVRSSVFSELKMGRTKKLSVATLEKIAAFFEVPVSMFLDDEDGAVEEIQNELFRKRKILFDLSAKASEDDLDKLILIVNAIVGD